MTDRGAEDLNVSESAQARSDGLTTLQGGCDARSNAVRRTNDSD